MLLEHSLYFQMNTDIRCRSGTAPWSVSLEDIKHFQQLSWMHETTIFFVRKQIPTSLKRAQRKKGSGKNASCGGYSKTLGRSNCAIMAGYGMENKQQQSDQIDHLIVRSEAQSQPWPPILRRAIQPWPRVLQWLLSILPPPNSLNKNNQYSKPYNNKAKQRWTTCADPSCERDDESSQLHSHTVIFRQQLERGCHSNTDQLRWSFC